MPTRLLKESIHQSERLNSLSDFQYRVWVNLITYVDDFGRGDARPAIIKGTCFPLRERLSNADIEAALQALAGAGCVGLYEVDGKPYLYFPRWESHQNIRNKKSKYDGLDHNGIPVVLSGLKEKDRRQLVSDHVQGLYLVSSVLHCAIDDLGGNQPEKGARISINDEESGGGFFREFYVASSVCEIGMLRIELEAIDE